MDIEGVLAIIFLFGGGTLFLLAISPIGKAIAENIRRKGTPAADAELRAELLEEIERLRTEELEPLRREMSELAERVDFAERLLAKSRDSSQLAPPHG